MLNVQAKTASTRNSVATIFIFSVAALESYWWQDKVYYTKPMSKIIVLIARKGDKHMYISGEIWFANERYAAKKKQVNSYLFK